MSSFNVEQYKKRTRARHSEPSRNKVVCTLLLDSITMSSKPKSKAIVDSSDDSDSDYKPKTKKPKEEKKKRKAAESDDGTEGMVQLSKTRFVNVRDFKGKVLIDIREYYTNADGEMKPGKKGISLSQDQWEKLKKNTDKIDEMIEDL
ncbi:activated RNA polymerase II transcriptional coactivator p15-like [Ptychodera flava]|uniref:activated RNA polymerase II transcriptional coactivator p15-like n=1 Tax=Ptychodera flava TaxID=63121 RepID=UPI00396A3ECC